MISIISTIEYYEKNVISSKLFAVITNVVAFNVISVGAYTLGIVILGEDIDFGRFFLYHGMQLLMHLEMAGICFGISAFMKKNKLGLGLGIVMIFYAFDLMARMIPDLKDYKLLTPFSYSNAADIFSTGDVEVGALVLGMIVMVVGVIVAYVKYDKKDLAA